MIKLKLNNYVMQNDNRYRDPISNHKSTNKNTKKSNKSINHIGMIGEKVVLF